MTNAEIKMVRSLREKKFRDGLGLFTVEGEKMVSEAVSSGMDVKDIYRTSEIGEETMSRISSLSSPSPVLAVVRKPQTGEFTIDGKLYLALDSVRDPGNIGTIIRTADWFGIDTVFASPDSVDIYNPKVIQSTMGGIFRVKVVYTNIPELCVRFRNEGLPVWGTFLDGSDIHTAKLEKRGLIVMGNESNGISQAVAEHVSSRLLIPKAEGSRAESLNVATATAITLAEFSRR